MTIRVGDYVQHVDFEGVKGTVLRFGTFNEKGDVVTIETNKGIKRYYTKNMRIVDTQHAQILAILGEEGASS